MPKSLIVLALGVAMIPAIAAAENIGSGPGNLDTDYTAVIRFGDLNLGTPDGQARLANRIDSAATGVCGRPGRAMLVGVDAVLERQRSSRCHAEFTATAHREVKQALAGRELRGAYASRN